MANLYSGTIECNGNYVDLSTETGVEFENGHDYQVQFFNKGYIREGEEGTGFRVYEGLPVTIKYQGTPVYVSSAGKLEVNIAN